MEIRRRGDAGYEEARVACVWNARIPDRFPDVIVRASDEQDVVRAVAIAADEEMTVGVCSGGHSWAASQLRHGGMLLDLSRLDDVSLDLDARTASVGPGVSGSGLAERLREHELFFPVGHCKDVALGGYLLQGGFGWLSTSSPRAASCCTRTSGATPTSTGRRGAPARASSAS
jgi:FAD/FMN-containing dehydrogenase